MPDPDVLPWTEPPPPGTAPVLAVADDLPHNFALDRHHDPTGVSGTGVVAFGTLYPVTGKVTLSWLGETSGYPAVGVYDSIGAVEHIHCHDGATEIVWLTGPSWPTRRTL